MIRDCVANFHGIQDLESLESDIFSFILAANMVRKLKYWARPRYPPHESRPRGRALFLIFLILYMYSQNLKQILVARKESVCVCMYRIMKMIITMIYLER